MHTYVCLCTYAQTYENITEFYRCLPIDEFSKMKKFASVMASAFGTIYVCEQTFPKMNM